VNRPIVVAVTVMTLAGAVTFLWIDARQQREYRRLLAVGDEAMADGQTLEAIEAFSGALTLKPESMIARLMRGETYRRRGEFASAVRDLNDAAALDPTAPRPLELLGDAHAAMGQHDAAASDYQRSLRLDDRAPHVVYKLGLAHYRNGNIPEAIDALTRAVALDDRMAQAHYLLGLCLRDRRPRDQAERALLRAVELEPTFAAAREELVQLYADSGRHRQAIEQLEALSALEPGRPERLVSVGLAYARLGRRDAAVLTLGRAAERHPDSSIVYTALGRVWLETAEGDNDRVALNKSLKALAPVAEHPDATSETLTMYGKALLLSGNTTAAERTLRRAVEQFPVEPAAFTYLATASRRLGHVAVAKDAETKLALLGDKDSVVRASGF
jgi:tetratricopeptide (TPR) repeat protein